MKRETRLSIPCEMYAHLVCIGTYVGGVINTTILPCRCSCHKETGRDLSLAPRESDDLGRSPSGDVSRVECEERSARPVGGRQLP
jgi:hypothetical protein